MKNVYSLMKMGGKSGGDTIGARFQIVLYIITIAALILPDYQGFVEHYYVARRLCGLFCGAALLMSLTVMTPRDGCGVTPRWCGIGMAAVIAVELTLAWWQYLHADELYLRGNFDNPVGLASAMILCLPFIARIASHRFLLWGIYSIAGISVVFSQCRIAIILFAAYLVWQHRRSKRIWIAVAVLLAVLCFLFVRKADSSSGRWFILQRCLDLVSEAPWLGHGIGGFLRSYMPEQAAYFQAHPDSPYALLAGNVTHPYNEYLLILVNFGLLGLTAAACIVFLIARIYHRHHDTRSPFFESLVLLLIFAFFSYPFDYPFTWFVLCQSIAVALLRLRPCRKGLRSPILSCAIIPAGCICAIGYCLYDAYRQSLWHDTYERLPWSSPSENVQRMTSLYPLWRDDDLFLYHFARSHYLAGNNDSCLILLGQRGRIAHDYYQEELLGQCLMDKGDLEKSLTHFETASAMFPCKFYPRYEMYVLNQRLGRTEECQKIRQAVRSMPIKIPSAQAEIYRQGILWEDTISIH